MKTKLLPILRYIVLALLLLCIVLCRFFPVMPEGYACHIYPWLSAALSAIASVFPFSLEEALVVVIILWMIIYPFLKRRKKKSWRFIVGTPWRPSDNGVLRPEAQWSPGRDSLR